MTARRPMPGARPHLGVPVVAAVGALVAAALGALGVVGIRDGVRATGLGSNQPWVPEAVDRVAGLHRTASLLPLLGVGAAVLGLLFLLAAVARRPTDAFRIRATTTVTIGRRDVARLVTAAVGGVPGLDDIGASASRRLVRIWVRAAGGDAAEEVRAAVLAAVVPRLAALDPTPSVRISVQRPKAGGSPEVPATASGESA